MSKKALLIGINYFNTENQLFGCLNDETNMCTMLTLHYGFKNIRVLRDDVPGALPTRANILSGIDWLVKDAKAGDQLVFCYSGHGTQESDRNGDERDGLDEAICPSDFENGMINDDLLKQRLVNKVPKGATLFCEFDCCHSGTILDLRYNVKCDLSKPVQSSYSLTFDPKYPDTKGHIICLTGCQDNQTSADSFEDGQAVGALTWGFLKVLSDNKFKISWGPLVYELRKLLKKKGYDQIPQLGFGDVIALDQYFAL